MREEWLSQLDTKITRLDIIDSNLLYIMTKAFNSDVFRGTLSKLKIDNSMISSENNFAFELLSKEIFFGLTSLTQLIITNMPELIVKDKTIFRHLENSLTHLTISQIAKPWILPNALNATVLKKISQVKLEVNHISSLDQDSFRGIAENVNSLYLTNSRIETIAAKTFSNFKSLQTLLMDSNLLQNLPSGVFDSLMGNRNIEISLEKNKWRCDCNLIDTKTMILENRSSFTGSIKCAEPEDLSNKEIVDADFCSTSTTVQLTSQSEIIEGCDEDGGDDGYSLCTQTTSKGNKSLRKQC